MVSRADAIGQMYKRTETYSDIATSFAKHPVTNELATVRDLAAVRQAFRNLVLTDAGERLFNPFLGSNVRHSMFENFTPFTVEDIQRRVRDSARMFEGRVTVLNVTVAQTVDGNGIGVDVVFSVANIPEPTSISIVLQRGR